MNDYKILVVDDEPIIRKILETILESAGYKVILAANGDEAIVALHNEKYDVVITDLQMGDPDGFAVLKKAKDLNPLFKGIVITGNKDVSAPIKAIEIGVQSYLLKPFSPNELLSCVKKSVDKLELDRKKEARYAKRSLTQEQIYSTRLLTSHDIRSALVSLNATLNFLEKEGNEEMIENMADELYMLSSRCAKLTIMTEKYFSKNFLIKKQNRVFQKTTN
jgi:DNA-binding NtrC family response regulator